MKLFFDLIPIVLFFIAFKFYDIYVATLVAMVTSLLQTLWHRYHTGKFENMHLITLATLLILGGMTLFFQNELFIKWKPTIVYWIFAVALLVTRSIKKQSTLSLLLGSKLTLPQEVWGRLDWAWLAFFVLLGIVNIWVAYQFDTETWVNFKLFGLMGLMLLFVLAQTLYIAKYLPKTDEPTD